MKKIQVLGFNDIERHALNSIVRLSSSRNPAYDIWQDTGLTKPDIILIDGQHLDAYKTWTTEPAQEKVIWVGDTPPRGVYYHARRPMQWMHVLQLMDDIVANDLSTLPPEPDSSQFPHTQGAYNSAYSGYSGATDFVDTIAGEFEQGNPAVMSAAFSPNRTADASNDLRKRILVIDQNMSFRMYLKALLSVGGSVMVNATGDALDALGMTEVISYDVILLDADFPLMRDRHLCQILNQASASMRPGDTRISRPRVYLLGKGTGLLSKLRARRLGADGILMRPRKQQQLDILFKIINRHP